VKWWSKAADKGLVTAMNNLAGMYAQGLGGLSADWNQAAKWYQKAADSGNASAMLSLSGLYANGAGVEKSEFQACVWAILAASYFPAGKMQDESHERFKIFRKGLSPEDQKRAVDVAAELQAQIESNRKKSASVNK
jgi:TPR repeat protein